MKLTATSPTQIGGKKVAYSNDEGAFRFSNLDPGVFEVRAEAPKLRTFVQQNVKVGINAPAEIDVTMEVASEKVEEVHVVEKAPLISTTTTSVKEVYDIDFVDTLPHDNRDVIFQQLPNYSAGTINGRIRGGNSNQTIYTMDGFNLFHEFPTVKASAAYEIQTAGYGADNVMAPGGVVNLVSRSGSNKFEAEMEATWDYDKFRLFKEGTDSRAPGDFIVLNPTISGPIIKDRLWYAFNVEFLTQKTGRDADVEGVLPTPPPELRNWYKGTAKLTWQLTQRNKLSAVMTFDEWWRWYAKGLGTDISGQEDSRSRKYFTGLIWESVLTDSLIFRSQAGVAWANTENFPDSCYGDPNCDFKPGTIITLPNTKTLLVGNDTNHNQSPGTFVQMVNRLEYFTTSKALGEHDFQLKDNLQLQNDVAIKSVPGDEVFEAAGTTPTARTLYYANDPRFDNARFGWYQTSQSSMKNALTLTDSWRPTRYLTLTPGGAYTHATGNNVRGDTVLTADIISPSLAAAWDATHDGRTVVRASFAEYLDADISAVAGVTNGGQVSQRCQWDDATQSYTKNCTYSGGLAGASIGKPCSPTGYDAQGNSCQQKLTMPRTWEVTAGGEREVAEGLAIGEDVVYRRFDHQFETFETNRIWDNAGTELSPAGFRNGRNQTVMDLETPSSAQRRYIGLTTSVTKREGRLKMQASYTWSRLRGSVGDGFSNLFGDIQGRDIYLYGPLGDDHTHEIKVNLSMHLNAWLSFSTRFNYFSGLPYNRFFFNTTTGKYENLNAQTGTNPGTNINDPGDDRPLRLPDQYSVNSQIAFNFQPLIGAKLEAFIDILNLLDLRETTSVTTNDGPSFGVESARTPSTRIRLGARYRY